jgi:hypothetical protein
MINEHNDSEQKTTIIEAIEINRIKNQMKLATEVTIGMDLSSNTKT